METKNVKIGEPRTLENDIKILSCRHRRDTFFFTSVDLSALTAAEERQTHGLVFDQIGVSRHES